MRYKPTGTTLTDHQRELMTILVEECAEVAQRGTKALRFGLDDTQPGQPFDNATRLAHEIGDLDTVVKHMLKSHMLDPVDILAGMKNKERQLAKYMQHKE